MDLENVKEGLNDDQLVEHIVEEVKKLNEYLSRANDRGLLINMEMVVLNGRTTPSLRLEAAYQRIDKPLILRA